ncbi:MAG: hypothetical protein PHR25_00430 [Clostridia bacterium]|nr:hypothetical protein [Clostridia bacterium]
MEKKKIFIAMVTIIISLAILVIAINLIFNNNFKINQGKFRISDALITSSTILKEKTKGEWTFDISQNNKIAILIQSADNVKIKEAYLEKIRVNSKEDVRIYIEQENHKISYKYEELKNEKVNIYVDEQEKGYLAEFDIINKDIVTDFAIPEEIKEIRHDGTILNIAGIKASEITFRLRYNLVIIEPEGKINKCEFDLKIPNEKVIAEGTTIERLDVQKLSFKVKY